MENTTKKITPPEHLANLYKSTRHTLDWIEKNCGARLVATFSSDSEFDEGIFILSGMDRLAAAFGVKPEDVTIRDVGGCERAEFELCGVKYYAIIEG